MTVPLVLQSRSERLRVAKRLRRALPPANVVLWVTLVGVALLGMATRGNNDVAAAPPPWLARFKQDLNGPPTARLVTANECEAGATLRRDQVLADMLFWYQRVLDTHPDPFRHRSREELERVLVRSAARLERDVAMADAYVAVAAAAAVLRDSHTAVAPPPTAVPRLPWTVDGDRLCMARAAGSVPAGACVETIQGKPVSELLPLARALSSSESRAGVDMLTASRLPFALPPELRTARLALTGRTQQGEVFAVEEPIRVEPREEAPSLLFSRLGEYSILITMRTMVGQTDAYVRGLNTAVKMARGEGLRGVVVDLRDNDGGSSLVGAHLLSRLSHKPFRMTSRKRWRVSKPMQQQFEGSDQATEEYQRAKPGTFLVSDFDFMEPAPVARRFAGPVVYLIGPRTQSAAVQDSKLGLLIGEPTSAPPNYFGEVHDFTLPCSGLHATVSTAEFVRVNGDASDTEVVKPHVSLRESRVAPAGGPDPTLSTALQAIHYWYDHRQEMLATSKVSTDPWTESEPVASAKHASSGVKD